MPRAVSHSCSRHCHHCPDLDGEIMPGCMGTAARANGPRDMYACTCVRRVSRDNVVSLERRVAKLEAILKSRGISEVYA